MSGAVAPGPPPPGLPRHRGGRGGWSALWPALLAASFVALLPTKTLANVPVLVMGAGGLAVLLRARDQVGGVGLRALLALFLALWLPMVLALPDAVDLPRGLATTRDYVRFAFAGVFVLWAVRGRADVERIGLLVFAIVTVWTLDGSLQAVVGRDLLGYPYDGGQLRGLFHPQLRFGLALAALSPLYLEMPA